jgi:LysM repeat protein
VARILAVMGLVVAAIVVIVVISSSLGGSDEGSKGDSQASRPNQQKNEQQDKYYVVQPGDTFAGIAAKEGFSVTRLEQLNPNLDTQLLPEQGCINLVPEGCKILANGD